VEAGEVEVERAERARRSVRARERRKVSASSGARRSWSLVVSRVGADGR
jgi:hypothetical protein